MISASSISPYADQEREDMAERLRLASIWMLAPLVPALGFRLLIGGAPITVRALAVMIMLGLVTNRVLTWSAVRKRIYAVAGLFTSALVIAVFCTLLDKPEEVGSRVGVIGALLVGSAILFPWGWRPQAMLSVILVGAFVGLVTATGGRDAHDLVAVCFSVMDCAGLSIIGAHVLDRQRRENAAGREAIERLARQRAALLAAVREFNREPDLDLLSPKITDWVHGFVGGDTAALILLDEERGIVRTAAISGALEDRDRELIGLEVPRPVTAPLEEALRAHEIVAVPGGPIDWMHEALSQATGVAAALHAGIFHDGRLLGWLACGLRRDGARFSEDQLRTATALASLCAAPLATARMVGDLQRASRIKSEFVSTMSHELRTPLAVMLGYTDIVADLASGAEVQAAVTCIRSAGAELLDLVEATLNLNRLESGHDRPVLAPTEIGALWTELEREFAAVRRADAVALRWLAPAAGTFRTDRRKLKIIVKNLVGNALKFTATGEVVASCRCDAAGFVIEVRDTGIGIAAEHRDRIFEMFAQLDSSDRRTYGGVGLGLYIVRQLVEQLGGTITVASDVGRGTTFTVTLPGAAAVNAAAPVAA